METAAMDTHQANDVPTEADTRGVAERFFELSIVRAQDNVRSALLILLLVVSLTSPAYTTNRISLYTSLIVGVLLTLWTRFAARWESIRADGYVTTAAGVVLLADFAWLALFVYGTGGLDSPFFALLLVPVIFGSAFFSLLRAAVALVTGLVVAASIFFALNRPPAADTPWRLAGMLFAVIAIAWVSYGFCLVLERERRTNELVVHHLSEGVLLIDDRGRIRLANTQLERFTGLPSQQILRHSTREVVEEPGMQVLVAILSDVQAPESDALIQVRDIVIDRPEPIDLRVSTIRLGGRIRRPAGWLIVCQDVTELKTLVRVRESGIRILSHEMRSPLTTFKMISSVFAELAQRLSDRRGEKLIQIVDQETDRMLRLVGQFLDVATMDDATYQLTLQEVQVPELVRRAADALEVRANEKQISVSTACEEATPAIAADPDRLEDALYNLCDNALKYTDAGGRIEIACASHDGEVRIAVSDTGCGIPPDKVGIVFEEFGQAHDRPEGGILERGIGLGLYMVRRIVELHGGRVEVQSEPDKGSTFAMYLPIKARAAGQNTA
jgi:PAS domain S-box-containing protein